MEMSVYESCKASLSGEAQRGRTLGIRARQYFLMTEGC